MSHEITVSKGQLRGEVSRQWASRPADERFLNLHDLRAQVAKWADESHIEEILPAEIEVQPIGAADLKLTLPSGVNLSPTHYAFGQIATMAGCPAKYLRTLPARLAALNLKHGLLAAEQKKHAAYVRQNGDTILRGVTGLKYGRIFDRDVADALIKVAGSGTGDTRWKVPGTIEWGGSHGIIYNPNVNITTENTTLYAGPQNMFCFLVDDMNPIEVGKLPSGAPDLMFRGFYAWNSEVGDRTFGVAQMYLRGVCQNRNLWGVEGFTELTFNHTAGAPDRFALEAAPALVSYAEGSTVKLIEGVKAAKAAIVSTDDDERKEFLARFGFSVKQAEALIKTAIAEDGRPQESVWDHAQAITAHARLKEHADARVDLEKKAGKMLDKVNA